MQTKHQSKAKAGLAAAAGIAVLLGGSSTFARWAQEFDAPVSDTFTETITNGDWEVGADGDIELISVWFDTHPNVVVHSLLEQHYQSVAEVWRLSEGPGDDRTYGDALDTWATANADLGESGKPTTTGTHNGQLVELDDVRLVPGDTLIGVYEFDPDGEITPNVKLNADHLRVYIDGDYEIGDPDWDDIDFKSGAIGDVITAVIRDNSFTEDEGVTYPFGWLRDNQVAVLIDYPWGSDSIQDSISHYETDNGEDGTAGGVSSVTMGVATNIKVTLIQRPECSFPLTWNNTSKTCSM